MQASAQGALLDDLDSITCFLDPVFRPEHFSLSKAAFQYSLETPAVLELVNASKTEVDCSYPLNIYL